ncbi:MAG: hypothetical protein MUE68_12195 [Bacteroidetes bacterium]|jgi:hypothetical protein|nr:hypothetical protein [Bacteroidota bacterium]
MDPYARNLIKTNFFHAKRPIAGSVVVVLDGYLDNRSLSLIQPISRAYPKHTIIELIATEEDSAVPGGSVQAIAYLGFVELLTSGVIVVGDEVVVKKKAVGTIAGYDDTHMPNHQNVIVKVEKRFSGKDLKWRVGERVEIKRRKRGISDQ